ncbi:predicted protein [Naegleria gruberi]|uniref:Predicted protein n=1 Tax=Naegleria gruberi TaxID=5762 RepID=D2V9E0_NAEGR|nr:uncharacterized protein NAEGRDRAFT_54817 [Naegleria gruberi]XP_002679187.1 uncharacterized protein NAEGRDRAFT_65408 [Naegleria gruberi]EFC35641.1 predicted protein [Naegleria gruberi]EFC46443.1 predicted protein [Naegleria gruberi]|eukprot:XP_002668385.1 predicted protein [Naegleria gruberi strain NEG-M]
MVAKKPQDIDSSSSDEDLPAVEVEYPTTPVKARKQQAAKKLRKLKAMSPVANRNKRKQSTSVSSSNSALDDGISTVVSSSLLSNSTLLDSSSTAPSSSNNSSSSNSGRDSFASSSSEHDIMAIKAQMQEMIGVLRTVTGNISELTKKVQEREEESDDDFVNPEAISPEVWLRQTYRDLRSSYNVPSSIGDDLLLSAVSSEILKDRKQEETKRRIQYLLLKYKDVISKFAPDIRLDEINSIGYSKLVELTQIKIELLEYALNSPLDFTVMTEITELCRMICKVEALFLKEGLQVSTFDVGREFLNRYISTNSFETAAESELHNIRTTYHYYKATKQQQGPKGITKKYSKKKPFQKKNNKGQGNGGKFQGKDKDKSE